MTKKILLIDDEPNALKLITKMVTSLGYECDSVLDPNEGLLKLRSERYGIIISDLVMPGVSGIGVVTEALRLDNTLQVILVTATVGLNPAIEAMKAGAADYIQKPFNKEQIESALVRVLEKKKLIDENYKLKARLNHVYKYNNIIGRSESMQKIFNTIERVAKTNASVLIHGESGTGKEMIAQAIHKMSLRNQESFVGVDCVSIPNELFESELFGFEKGAFTGANSTRQGLFSEANKGTFFFDEVTEIDINTQAKLLRVLQERNYRRVGGRELLNLDIRVLAATKREPLKAVEEGLFREDLYYRLNVLPIILPPLRERREDIPLLVESFIEDYTTEYNTKKYIDRDAMLKLQTHEWPGNIRELKNIITRLCIMCPEDVIQVSDLPDNITKSSGEGVNFEWLSKLKFKDAKEKWLEDFEIKYIEHILKRYSGNLSESARNSGVNRKTFQRLIAKHNIKT
jgi:two-component system, NtrC family, response regulator HydG